jgi:hypothetical protein
MDSNASSVTLIFYKLNKKWWEEAGLNLLAAAAQMSSYTHVEIQIGNNHAPGGQMINVARVFNDSVGVELCQRTGKNPGTLPPPLYAHIAPLSLYNEWLSFRVRSVLVSLAGLLRCLGAANAAVRARASGQALQQPRHGAGAVLPQEDAWAGLVRCVVQSCATLRILTHASCRASGFVQS